MLQQTEEQKNIRQMALSNNRLKINACAGSGKSTTLCMVAEDLEGSTLVLVFNKAAQLDLECRVPSGVVVKTTHSLAYSAVGYEYQDKLSRPRGKYTNVAGTGAEIARYYKIQDLEGSEGFISGRAIGVLVKDAVRLFEQSASPKLGSEHIKGIRELSEKKQVDSKRLAASVLKYAKKLWKDRTDKQSIVLCTHDTYLKLYQLSKPTLRFNNILLDEAQDTSPCVLDIITNQPEDKKVILVGDQYQMIYGWRGAINAMKAVSWPAAKLSQTFRFGKSIADVANNILNLKDFVKSKLDNSKVLLDNIDTQTVRTQLYRTNAKLLQDGVSLLDKGVRVNFEIDPRNFISILTSAVALYRGEMSKVKHESIVIYDSWDELTEDSKSSNELKIYVNIITTGAAERTIQTLKYYEKFDNPQVIMTTAHKSKGREWDYVRVMDDFPSNYYKDEWIGLSDAERNLLYVACTRAKVCLVVNSTYQEILEDLGGTV